jgi:biofilm protein TabA
VIIDKLANIEFYRDLYARLFQGLTFLKESDVVSLPVGRYDIDSDAVFTLAQEYETHLSEECRWEAHYTYTDIQYVVEGSEKIGWNTLDGVMKTEDRPENDVYLITASKMVLSQVS